MCNVKIDGDSGMQVGDVGWAPQSTRIAAHASRALRRSSSPTPKPNTRDECGGACLSIRIPLAIHPTMQRAADPSKA